MFKKLKDNLPDKLNKKSWIRVFGVTFFSTFIVFLLIIGIVFGEALDFESLYGAAAISSIISIIACLSGFLGSKITFVSTYIGVAVGLIALIIISSTDTTGWGGLIGFSMFLQASGAGFVLGLLIEALNYTLRKIKSKK